MKEKTTTSGRKNLPRDSSNPSPWQKGPFDNPKAQAIHNPEAIYDVLVIGGGITGVTTALLLQQRGKKVILAEAHIPGFGTTGGTSAHLNTFFDATYPEIESDFGEGAAKLVAKAGKEAFKIITSLIEKYNIDCDLEYKDAFLFSQDEKEDKELASIRDASAKAGIRVKQTAENGVPVPFTKALLFPGQGQFHPLKYLYRLAGEFVKLGGVLLEHTPVSEHKLENGIHIAGNSTVQIQAKNLVFATHLPPGINIMDLTCAPYRSYVLGIRLKDDNYPSCLAYDMKEPYHYFRTHEIDGQKYLLLGGEDHKTGHGDPEKAFEQLEAYARQYYHVASVAYKWSSQYYVPADGLPYIGQLPGGEDNTYIATGYNGNGITFGTLAARILADTLCGKKNPYAELLKPSRIKPLASFEAFVKENADVAYHFLADRLSPDALESLKSLPKEEGTIVKYQGEQLAIYKDKQGKISALNPVCTHARCIVHFNPAEKSWDCPCHGGRFDLNGHVLTGPPRRDLEKVI
ncbi:FAD-dependent oxidoreductase [Pedobacter sp. BS3]|uniref:FAD-dependent oxidoreductase n=1 Tax=Pedobacter sp. BS3 TaxID=2567937 RepID=UPI0011EF64A8|nr:FAD-dependent oxidoreductase [Pedobacter sp. BS3]TZF84900.1 FAD-dependent oxidoreductase [Pedobacter sp. BS3]